MIQRWAQGKSFRCPAYIISFFFFFFPCLKPAGLFHACNFAGTEGKARRFNAGENCFFLGGGTRLQGNVFSQVWSVQVHWICSPLEHTSAHSARTWRIHTLTQCTTPELLSTSRGREREKKKKIHYSDDWLCCRMGRPWAAVLFLQLKEDLGGRRCATATVRTYSFKSPTPDLQITPTSRHSKKPSQLILRQFTQDNVTLHTRKPRRWKMCIRRAAVTYVSAVSAPSTHRRALNPSLNTVNAVRYREVQRIPNPFHHL